MVAGRKDRWSDIIGGDGCTVPLRYSFFMIETLDRCCKEREGGREKGIVEGYLIEAKTGS
jgi:hypothetical protein